MGLNPSYGVHPAFRNTAPVPLKDQIRSAFIPVIMLPDSPRYTATEPRTKRINNNAANGQGLSNNVKTWIRHPRALPCGPDRSFR